MRVPSEDTFYGCAALIIIGGICLSMFGCCGGWMLGGIPYSDGHRDGFVQKLSRKGLVWTTTEGELAMPGLRTTGSSDDRGIANTWDFSVNDQDSAEQLEEIHANEMVRLYYKQYLLSPPWRGDTGYFVIKVERLKMEKQ